MIRIERVAVNLHQFEKTRAGALAYAYQVRQALPDKFFTKDWSAFIRELAPFPSRGTPVTDPEKHAYDIARTITEYFGLFDADDPDWNDPVTTLLEKILGIRGIDSPVVYTENDWILDDLRIIGDIIEAYENDEFIRRLKKEGIRPRNHEERIKADFYQRSKEEQGYIVSSMLNKAPYPISWHSGNPAPVQREGSSLFIEDHYRFKTSLDWQDFNYLSIDSISHRLGRVPAKYRIRLEKIYRSDKALFYHELERYLPPKKVLKDIRKTIAMLPLHSDRYQLFDEIAALYRAQHWIGLFAIALSQVEGLFTEMVEVLAERSHYIPSLSDKVAYVRKQSYLRLSYFDYFQYVVPRLRNKFMHAGYADDYRLRAMDLLYDLHYLLGVFNELNTDYIVVSRIIRYRRSSYFDTTDDIAFFLSRLASLNTYQWQKLKEEYYRYEKEILSPDSNFIALVDQIIETFPKCCAAFEELLNTHHALQQAGVSFATITLSKKLQLQVDEDTYSVLIHLVKYEMIEMRIVVQFMQYYAHFLPSLPGSHIETLSKLKAKYRQHMAIYNAIGN